MTDTSSVQRAVTLHQPWATLTMLRSDLCIYEHPLEPTCSCPMVKQFETRPMRAPSTIIGERIWIHAAARTPAMTFGRCTVGDYDIGWSDTFELCDSVSGAVFPLGALVGSAVIGEPIPIVDERPSDASPYVWVGDQILVYRDGAHGLNVTEERPYGDWRPGRWVWPLLDVRPLAEPIPAKGAQGIWFCDVPFADAGVQRSAAPPF